MCIPLLIVRSAEFVSDHWQFIISIAAVDLPCHSICCERYSTVGVCVLIV